MKTKILILLLFVLTIFGGVIAGCSGGGKQNFEKDKESVTELIDNVIEDNWD